MLNLVPIQFLALFGYAILRIVVGWVWCQFALRHYRERAGIIQTLHVPFFPWPQVALVMIVGVELLIGLLFLLGLFTQIAAALGAIWCIKLLILRNTFAHESFPDRITTILLLAICVTLFITGAGVLAFDLPI
jgi:uncharacterized membrane protein YphA (DoxX/SURF4 family)